MRSVSAPRFERGLVVDLYTPSHASRLRDLSRILIESVPFISPVTLSCSGQDCVMRHTMTIKNIELDDDESEDENEDEAEEE